MTLRSLAFFLKAARKLRNIPQSIPAVVITVKGKNISRGSRKIIELFSGKLMMLGLVEHQIISTEPLCIPWGFDSGAFGKASSWEIGMENIGIGKTSVTCNNFMEEIILCIHIYTYMQNNTCNVYIYMYTHLDVHLAGACLLFKFWFESWLKWFELSGDGFKFNNSALPKGIRPYPEAATHYDDILFAEAQRRCCGDSEVWRP